VPKTAHAVPAGGSPTTQAQMHVVGVRVHLGKMAGNHFPRENVSLSTQGMCKKVWFFKKKAHFSRFLGDVLRTLCWAERILPFKILGLKELEIAILLQ
jgi:hypothetical protein